MRLDKINKKKNFTRHFLEDFMYGMFDLLKTKPLEKITIAELCKRTNYPRSTFYNYFEDISSLMDYCWQSIADEIQIGNFLDIEHDKRTLSLFNSVYDYLEEKRSTIDLLLKNNEPNGELLNSLNRFMRKTIYEIVNACPYSYIFPVPYELIAKHYSNTIQMVLSACFLDKTLTRAEACSYIDFLLGTLEKESTRE